MRLVRGNKVEVSMWECVCVAQDKDEGWKDKVKGCIEENGRKEGREGK